MANIGRAFGFYIQYWKEMQACYEDEAPLGPLARKDTPEMIKRVGLCAGKQAAELVTECGTEISKHFSEALGYQTRVTTRQGTKERDWNIELKLDRRVGRRSQNVRWMVGASISDHDDGRDPTLFLWIWARGQGGMGRRQAEEEIARLLGPTRVRHRSADIGWYAGTVAFGEVSLLDKIGKNFDIKLETVLGEVKASLQKIRKKDVERLFEI